jgi:hypothetical protein
MSISEQAMNRMNASFVVIFCTVMSKASKTIYVKNEKEREKKSDRSEQSQTLKKSCLPRFFQDFLGTSQQRLFYFSAKYKAI